ncbi:MAG: metallophosphoesterase [Draconibacterium sp.]|nr:metallophosphoesterase [Draconibacterium sp.]
MIQKVRIRGLRSQTIKEFTLVNDCFSDKRNEEVGLYGQTLIKKTSTIKDINKMKIQYCSDLHLEFSANYSFLKRKPIKPLGDILILAGDIIYLEERFFIHDFFDYCSANFDATYMICGNHEFYNGSDVSLYQKPICNNIRKNVFIVNNIQIPIKDVNFVFSTLWSKIDYKNSWEIKNRLNDFYKIKVII